VAAAVRSVPLPEKLTTGGPPETGTTPKGDRDPAVSNNQGAIATWHTSGGVTRKSISLNKHQLLSVSASGSGGTDYDRATERRR